MAKFKQITQNFVLKKLLEYFRNMVKNYTEDCHDDDFFAVVRNSFDHDKAVELIETAYTAQELKELQAVKSRYNRLDLSDSTDDIFQALWNFESLRGKCKTVLDSIVRYIAKDFGCDKTAGDVMATRFRKVKEMLKLNDLEAEIFMLAYVRDNTCFCWPCRVDDRDKPMFFAMALDRSYAEVSEAVSAKGKLMKFGVLDSDYDFNRRTLGGYMDGVSEDAIERRFYKKVDDKEVLPWSFYGNLAAKDGEIIKRMVSASEGKCNILLYGAPGTGKTSFALSLAKELGRTPFEVRQGDDDGRNMKPEARMIGIQVCNSQESPKESLMVVDEADELLRGTSCGFSLFGIEIGGGGGATEKGVMNSILDEMKVPTIWISNAPAFTMDESVRRRFDYSICFERMNNAQRVSIWRNVVAKLDLGGMIPEAKLSEYASAYATSAGGITNVLENVKRMKPAPDKVDELIATLMKPHCKLMGIKEGNRFLPAKGYSLEGLNIKGKVKLDRLVAAVRNYLDASFNAASEDRPRMNVLLYGPPGTGKTEFVKYLGKTLDRKVLVVKGSDILGKYVGESEKNIARAFRQAEAEHAILFFDEIDGLLQDRANADHSWEITQVNELLQQMENFDGVMIAATNFSKNLDPATMRRFTFKLEFGYLDGEGRRLFFERMFNTRLTEEEAAELDTLRNLAPGDFRTVRQEQFYLASEQTNLDRIAALREECAVKKDDGDSAPIGFAA